MEHDSTDNLQGPSSLASPCLPCSSTAFQAEARRQHSSAGPSGSHIPRSAIRKAEELEALTSVRTQEKKKTVQEKVLKNFYIYNPQIKGF